MSQTINQYENNMVEMENKFERLSKEFHSSIEQNRFMKQEVIKIINIAV